MAKNEDEALIKTLLQRDLLKREDLVKLDRSVNVFLSAEGITRTLIKFLKTDEHKIAEIIAEEFDVPQLKSLDGVSWINVPGLINEDLLKYRIIPIILEEKELTIAFIDPPYRNLVELLEKATHRRITPVIITVTHFDTLSQKKEKVQTILPRKSEIFDTIDVAKRGVKWAQSPETVSNLPSGTNVVLKIIEAAIDIDASDIHFEITQEGFLNIRFRTDGVLQRTVTLPKTYTSSIPAIIKQSGSVDSFKKRGVQEGQVTFTARGRKIHTRINVIPTSRGETLTLRILDKILHVISLDKLGLSHLDFSRFKQLLSYPDGIILFAGPAGCGKTTTMYSALNELNHVSKKISTIENPIECIIDGINQTSVAVGQQITFTEGGRALFHHDVDVLGVGEIRDTEQAELLIEAGLTGMKACSTLQSSDAIKSIFRLQNLGVKKEELSLVLRGIVAQRIVRKVCPYCAEKYRPDKDILQLAELLNLPEGLTLARGKGCKDCFGTGYLKRIPLFETLLIDDKIGSLIYKGSSYGEIKFSAERLGFVPMRLDGLRKALAGVTTLQEVLRVT